jgi:hypothetical protein
MFIHVPKNAGTSLQANYTDMGYDDRNKSYESRLDNRKKAEVEHYFPNGDVVHNKWSYFKNDPRFQGFTPIALLRNPWDRALSIYTFSLERAKKELGSEWANYDHPLLIKQGFKTALDGRWLFCRRPCKIYRIQQRNDEGMVLSRRPIFMVRW